MKRIILENKPLIEAIFEIRWQLQDSKSGGKIDPPYKLLVGRLSDKLDKEYPFYEQMPTASIPDELSEYNVQHRFRKSENKWPLIQIGPGILAINDTKNYTWEDFEKRIIEGVKILFEIYPNSSKNLIISSIMLRYIDAIEFDYKKEDIFKFLKDQMKIEINLTPKLFKESIVEQNPLNFNGVFSYSCAKPKAIVNLRVGRGKKRGIDTLMWETIVHSQSDIPQLPSGLGDWLFDAHNVTDDWFFTLIEGELLERFK